MTLTMWCRGEGAVVGAARWCRRFEARGVSSARAALREPPIADLDSLPFPDYSLVDIDSYHRVGGRTPSLRRFFFSWMSLSVCLLQQHCDGGGAAVRFRSAANVVQEIRLIKAAVGHRLVSLPGRYLHFNLPRLREMTALLRDEVITYRCFGRVDRCSQRSANLLYEGGCKHISFGVESGSPAILERMQKGQTTDQIRQGIATAKLAGLIVRVYLIVGFPGETWDGARDRRPDAGMCSRRVFGFIP